MTWVRLDDHFDEHPKVAAAGPLGIALYVVSIAYSNRNLTDGFIPTTVAPRLIDTLDPNAVITALLDQGLWKQTKGGYRIHDYHEYQLPKERILAERAAARARMADVRKRKGKGADSRGSPELREKFGRSSRYPTPKEPSTEGVLGGGSSPTTRDASAPTAPEGGADAHQHGDKNDTEEDEHVNGKAQRTAYDYVRDLIANGWWALTDESLIGEMDMQEKRRGPMNDEQRAELLFYANELRAKENAT